jgi:hypothetical protein
VDAFQINHHLLRIVLYIIPQNGVKVNSNST